MLPDGELAGAVASLGLEKLIGRVHTLDTEYGALIEGGSDTIEPDRVRARQRMGQRSLARVVIVILGHTTARTRRRRRPEASWRLRHTSA